MSMRRVEHAAEPKPSTSCRFASVQGNFDVAPIWHVLRKDGLKARAVRWLDEVSELMHDDIIDGARRLFGQFEIEHDVAGARAACPPFAFHGADADAGGADAESLLPLRDERVEVALKFATAKPFEVPLDFGGVVRVTGGDDEARLWARVGAFCNFRSRPAGSGLHLEQVIDAEELMLLPCGIV